MSEEIKENGQENKLKGKALDDESLEHVSGGIAGAYYPNCGGKGCYGCDGRILYNCPVSNYKE